MEEAVRGDQERLRSTSLSRRSEEGDAVCSAVTTVLGRPAYVCTQDTMYMTM